MTFQLYSSILLILFSYIPVKSLASENNFETVETAPECRRIFNDPNEWPKSTLEVFHLYGPCSPAAIAGTTPMNMPSAQDILHRDRQRVESLQSRFKPNSTTKKYNSRFQDTKEVAYWTVLSSTSSYAISISLGTPLQVQTLVFDTASDLTWSNKFHPYASTSLTIITCDKPTCIWLLRPHTCETFNNIENTCHYKFRYGDGSYTKGALCKDILNITQTSDVFQYFVFGCETESEGLFKADGILGLGRDPKSFLSQTKHIYKRIFSYCFPSSPISTGFLKLGPRDNLNNVKFTSLFSKPDHPSLYFIEIISIRVADVELSIDNLDIMSRRTIIDTGTVITRLPMNVYTTMRDEFKNHVSSSDYQIVPDRSLLLDTCYDNSKGLINTIVPTITFTFKGGVTVDMDASATLYAYDEGSVVCLAFAGNSNSGDLTVFGSTQQKKLEVVYDVEGDRLAFIPGGCH